MVSRRRWVWPTVAWVTCVVLTFGFSAATWHVFWGCDDSLIWGVLGPPTLFSVGAFIAAVWAFKRVAASAARWWWAVAGLASALMFGFYALALYFSLWVPCSYFAN